MKKYPPVKYTNFPDLTKLGSGKVRDIYECENNLVLVSTDRISALDYVLPNPIPGKGVALNLMASYWLNKVEELGIAGTHLITIDHNKFPRQCLPYINEMAGRSMLVKKAKPLPVECVVRGYLSGSGWKDYQKNGEVCGIPLRKGLRESEILDKTIFTPSTKAEQGSHDENIGFESVVKLVGLEIAEELRRLSITIYDKARAIAAMRGIIIADTKFEFGMLDGEILLIDEALTPDSSRFWPQDDYEPGRSQVSYDKQPVRDWLSKNMKEGDPVPELPAEVIQSTTERYLKACEILTGINIRPNVLNK